MIELINPGLADSIAKLAAAMPGIYVAASNPTFSLVFAQNNKECLRMAPDGELIFNDATDAANALMMEWNRLRAEVKIATHEAALRRALHALVDACEGEPEEVFEFEIGVELRDARQLLATLSA